MAQKLSIERATFLQARRAAAGQTFDWSKKGRFSALQRSRAAQKCRSGLKVTYSGLPRSALSNGGG